MPRAALRSLLPTILLAATAAAQQPAAQATFPTFTPDHPNGIYAVNERVGWTVTLPAGSGFGHRTLRYTLFRNGADSIGAGTIDLASGRARIETRLATPATLIVEVRPPTPDSRFGGPNHGGPGRYRLGAAVEPTRIRAAEPKPADFDRFWASRLQMLARIPMAPVVTPGESNRPGVSWERVRLDNVNGAHVWGQLARPARAGRFPGLVIYQWASPPYPLQKSWVTDRAAEGWLALNVEPHDVPPDMPADFYANLPAMIKQYNTINQTSRDESYFLQMYLGAYRALQYLRTRPEWDGKTVVVMGTSMGGQQSFAVAGLDSGITALIVEVPAGADVTAALHRRWASYPNWDVKRPEVLRTARYFDTANFGSRITAQSMVAMGFIDDVSAPAGIWAVFNGIRGRKEMVPMVDSPHNHLATPQQLEPWTRRSAQWLDALVHGRDPMR